MRIFHLKLLFLGIIFYVSFRNIFLKKTPNIRKRRLEYSSSLCIPAKGDAGMHCVFENLCINKKGLFEMFLKNPNKNVLNILIDTVPYALLDPVSIAIHNGTVPSNFSHVLEKPVIIFQQHYPINFCHAIFDDMFGLFVIVNEVNLLPETARILLLPGATGQEKFFSVLKRFFPLISVVSKDNYNTRFMKAYTGSTNFRSCHYSECKYGKNDASLIVDRYDLVRFAYFVSEKKTDLKQSSIYLMGRKKSRLILNMNELELSLHTKARYPSRLTFKEQVELAQNASVIIGMHGAGLINIMFSPTTTALLEIFPYKCRRSRPVYRDICREKGMLYSSYENDNISNAVFHEKYLNTLPLSMKTKVIDHTYTGDVFCGVDRYKNYCSQTELYYLQQDTIINVSTVLQKLKEL